MLSDFLALKRIKSTSRNKIGDRRLDNLAFLSIESRLSKEVDVNYVIDAFPDIKNRLLEIRHKYSGEL